MESTQDNLHNSGGNEDGAKEKSSVAEESMVNENERNQQQEEELLVSTDDTTTGQEPEFKEAAPAKPDSSHSDEESGDLEEDALVAESSEKAEEAIVSENDVLSDEELESEDTHSEHVASDEDDDEDHHDSIEHKIPDYAEMPPKKLLSEAEKLIKNEPIDKIKDHIDAIRKALLHQLAEERQQKLKEFVDKGGNEIDFQYVQPLREELRSLYSDYRKRRQKHYDELQDKLNSNLRIKLGLIEKLKEIVTKDESIGDTFKEFNAIQQEWRNTGPVPRSESGDLWRTYHHHVENFYEYIKINKELRDLDFKKNRDIKEQLIKEAEKLTEQDHVMSAFKKLQELHKKWKQTGPVERENREPMWERFSDLTKQIHEKRDAYFTNLREKADEFIEKKKKLNEELRNFDHSGFNTHHQWQDAIKKVDKIRQEFRQIGRLNHPENDKVWDDFRAQTREFNHAKNQFYKGLKKQHQVNLDKKRKLVEIAESLKDSEDWRNTTNEMKRIQAEWKKVGHVPKSESDKIWKKFRSACNHFFDRLTEHNKDRDKQFEGNYEQKQTLLGELKAYDTASKDQKENVGNLKGIINRWKQMGPVPRNKKKIESDFNKALDQKFQEIDLNRQESQRIRFENKMESLSDQGGERELRREKDTVSRNLAEAQKELAQLENNLSFFTSSNPNNPFIKEAEKNINRQREQIALLQEKQSMLSTKIREMRKEEDSED